MADVEHSRSCACCDGVPEWLAELEALVVPLTLAMGHAPPCPHAAMQGVCGKAQEATAAQAEGAYVVREVSRRRGGSAENVHCINLLALRG